MGTVFIDIFTFQHGLAGLLAMLLYPNYKYYIRILPFLVLMNIFHLLIEMVEKDRCRGYTKLIESYENHIGDIFGFAIGTFLGYFLLLKKKNDVALNIVLHFFVLLFFFKEVIREVFPNNNIPFFKGVFVENCEDDS